MKELTFAATLVALALCASETRAEDANEAKRRQAAHANTCFNAKVALENHLLGLPTDCKKTSECTITFLHADSCVPGYLVNKRYEPGKDPELLPLQARARDACAAEWSGRPACEPNAQTPVCHEGRCIPKSWLPVKLPEKALRARLTHATITNGCAPHDAPSWILTFSAKKRACGKRSSYPRVGVNWWGGRPELPIKGPFALKSEEFKALSASFCAAAGACRSAKALELEFSTLDRKGGRGSFRLTLDDGQVVEQSFDAEFCEGLPTPCG